MAVEIERKFLIDINKLTLPNSGDLMYQAYLTEDPARTVRIRIAGEKAFLTIKGPSRGISRAEFEYSIPVIDAKEIIKLSIFPPVIKTRYKIPHQNLYWEVDVFHDKNEGLILAEIELPSENQHLILPDWIKTEVSNDPRYFNSYLARHPFSDWPENKQK